MKQYIRSLRLFTAQYTVTTMLQLLAAFAGAYAVIGIMGSATSIFAESDPDSFFAGFLSSFIPGCTIMVPLFGVFLLNAIYSYNMPITPGYKYLHGIADSAKHFKRAIIATNIIAVIIGGVGTLINWVLTMWVGDLILSPIASLAVCLGGIGLANFTGYLKSTAARLISIMPMCAVVGFVVGFTAAAEEDGEMGISDTAFLIVLAVTAVIAVAGFVYSMLVCEKKWRADK